MLFNRITCALNMSAELENYLSYELSSLFKDRLMRKNMKGEMGTILLEGMVPMSEIPENA